MLRRIFGKQRPPETHADGEDQNSNQDGFTWSNFYGFSLMSSKRTSQTGGIVGASRSRSRSNQRKSAGSLLAPRTPDRTLRLSTDAKRRSLFPLRDSYLHRDFDNPQSETCWLSCLFQALWHCSTFHSEFERHLTSESYTVAPNEKIIEALQHTWEAYRREDLPASEALFPELVTNHHWTENPLVCSDDLADAFGEGYGDMSEALATMQDELSHSKNKEARRIADLFITVPLVCVGVEQPRPADAWQLIREWTMTETPIFAVDLSMQSPSNFESRNLAELWIPKGNRKHREAGKEVRLTQDLGDAHELVSIVCFMWRSKHYVAFCRRRRDPNKCVFFNDIPNLVPDVPKELDWTSVPSICGKYGMTPRLVLFEAPPAAKLGIHGRNSAGFFTRKSLDTE